MKNQALMGIAALSLIVGLSISVGRPGAARADDERHSPDAHMDQNADLYRYDYDDGVCTYHYEYDFKTLKDKLDEKGDCRNVPIQRYRPQAAIAPAYPPPAAAPPVMAPGPANTTVVVPQSAAPSVTVGQPQPQMQTQPEARAPAGITVAPLQ